MHIQEATRQAMDEGRYIITPEWVHAMKIKPTNGTGRCIAMKADGSNPSKYGWQPSADDLIRDDWMVVD